MRTSPKGARTSQGRHPIRVVTRRTGLTAAALRAWERRYGAVVPGRTEGGQRLYSDEDIERLILLRRAVAEGRSIGHIAGLTTEELEGLIQEDEAARGGGGVVPGYGDHRAVALHEEARSPESEDFLRQAMEAAERMESRELELILTRGAMALTTPTLVDQVMVPLLRRIGLLWARGEMGPATEHMASTVVRRFLDWVLSLQAGRAGSPSMVVATPSGQVHEFGALLAGVTAATLGWRVLVLGPDLPGGDIGEAVHRTSARAVALSALLPGEPRRLEREVRALREAVGEEFPILMGGPGAHEIREVLLSLDVRVFDTLAGFRSALEEAPPGEGGEGDEDVSAEDVVRP